MKKGITLALLFSGALVSQAFANHGTLVSRDGSPVLDRSGKGCETRYQTTSLQTTPVSSASKVGS